MDVSNQMEDAVFYAAMSVANAEQRKAFLDQACSGNASLRLSVEKMLAVQGEAENFFLEGRSALSLLAEDVPATMPAEVAIKKPEDAEVGTQVGPYKLLQRLGEGGCGVVYMAEQRVPMHRRVALKVIKLGMDTKNVIARFNAERQALALMDHPNIARVLDAGAMESGRPYFVMELVRGVKITDYCDQNQLDTPQRLALFIQVCHAIQHAHQKGVIHRDIKPSNVLVTMSDGTPMPKVIDFGIAKAIEGKLSEQTLFTAYEQIIGTPAYMSPEQAQMSNLDVDTRSDIYSLGVLLYELLTGKTPFDSKALARSGLDEMRRTLRETEPRRPSMVLTTLHGTELQATAAHRHAEPPKLISMLKGDLDWIVMKALEKDRTRRYETASQLLLDVQRYLSSEPVMARPPSRIYRFKKLVLRNKIAFVAGAIVGLALITDLGMSNWLFLKEREARQEQARLLTEAKLANQRESELRQQSEDREKITQAAVDVSQGKFEQADRELAGIKNPVLRPSYDGVAALRQVATWLALQSRWQEAADRFYALMDIDKLDNWSTISWDYQSCGTVLADNGDTERYARFCKASISQFANTTNGTVAWRLLRTSLLLPTDKELTASLQPFAEVSQNSLKQLAGRMPDIAWGALPLSLWQYRNANYQAAAEICQHTVLKTQIAALNANLQIILAMSCFHLGRLDEARTELNRGRQTVQNKFKTPLNQGDSSEGYWWDWVDAQILMREAEMMIEGKASAADTPNPPDLPPQ